MMRSGYNAPIMRTDVFQDPLAPGKPWGLAATLGLSLIVWYSLELLQAAMGSSMGRVLITLRLVHPAQSTQAMNFAVISCISAVLCGALVIAAARLREEIDTRQYLGLGPVPGKELTRWLIVTAVIVVQTDLVLYLAKGELLPAEWIAVYRTVQSPALFWFALVVATPVFEELLFRGFVFEGIRASRLGGTGAVAITALVWTLVHRQDDPLEFAVIFILGVMLGIARLRTGSILVTMAMHMLNNLISVGEMAWLAQKE
jgi:membrane protease YdiL (CAAX protease family)